MWLFDHIKGALHGALRGLACCLGFLSLGLINYFGTVLYFIFDLFNTLVTAPIAFLASLYPALITPFPNLFTQTFNLLKLAFITIPALLIQTAINIVGSTLSLFYDFAWNTAVNVMAAVLTPVASFIDGAINGYKEDTANLPKTSRIMEELGLCFLNQNLPLNEHLEVNQFYKSLRSIQGQNTFFAGIRPASIEESCSFAQSTYKTLP